LSSSCATVSDELEMQPIVNNSNEQNNEKFDPAKAVGMEATCAVLVSLLCRFKYIIEYWVYFTNSAN
jgi:hypothetical protein